MLGKMTFYVKNQGHYFLLLQFIFVLPLALFLRYSSYPLPSIEYVVMATLFVSQYVLVSDKSFQRKFEHQAVKQLKRQTGKLPSKSHIVERLVLMREARTFMVIMTLVILIVLTLAFQ